MPRGDNFKFTSDSGLFYDLPVSDEYSELGGLSLVSPDGRRRAPDQIVWIFVDIISSGDSLSIVRKEKDWNESDTNYKWIDKEILFVEYKGGNEAMQLFRSCVYSQ